MNKYNLTAEDREKLPLNFHDAVVFLRVTAENCMKGGLLLPAAAYDAIADMIEEAGKAEQQP